MKVSELAKKAGIGSKELLAELKRIGSRAASPASIIEASAVKQILAKSKKESKPVKGEKKATGSAKTTTGTKSAATAKTAAGAKSAKGPTVKKPSKKSPATKPAVKAAPKAVKLKKPEPPPPEPPKRTRVLIKKKVVPSPEPVAAVPEGGAPALPETPVQPKIDVPPAAAAAPPPESGVLHEKLPPEHGGGIAVATKPEEAAADKRKLLKTDLFEVAKQELSDRLKQRGKKTRKTRRGRDGGQKDSRFELSSWKDIRPSARREVRPKPIQSTSSLEEITKPRKKIIKISEGLTIKDFAELIGQKAPEIIRKLVGMGTMATINQPVDLTAAAMIAESYGLNVEAVQEITEDELLQAEEPSGEGEALSRQPVVTIMGHVDHGKTSLLDAIRSTKVAAGEAGGITQHIGAYTVKVGERTITFFDTPGHEAFTAMRARGAQVTDIVILVVAADDGVMPQTVEAINHARAANVPIIVAINKIDKPDANPERVKNSLAEHNLLSESWGGQSIFVEVSAKKKLNLDSLLEMVLLQADVLELKADPNRMARGVVVEARMDKGRGPVATILVQSGTLNVGDAFVTGTFFGRVRALNNDEGKKIKSAGPSQPVEVIGLLGVPQAGDTFAVVGEERVAREIASKRMQKQRTAALAQRRRITLEDLYNQIKEGSVKELNLIMRADVQGSVEALKESLDKLPSSAVKLNIIHSGVGGITETDVLLASASSAIIIGFNIRPETKAAALAEREKVDIRFYNVIYDAITDIRAAMEGLLEPTLKERITGRCDVRQVFSISKLGTIAGVYVTEGTISRANSGLRVLRDSVVIYEGKPSSLKRFKDDVHEVQAGYECGIGVEKFNDIKVGDVIEAFVMDKIAAKL